ncbi:MAG TPA: hypothetical protein VK548_14040 [Candidatus Acidoferrum sp.]|nr:hypothetical protein [Candidatus Acidoferrum sp.]
MARTAQRKRLAIETLFEVFDPDLERGDVLLQLGQITLQDLAARPFIGVARLDAAQRLRDREVLLLDPLEAPVELIEMAEHLTPQVGNLMLHAVDAPINRVEATRNFFEL